MSGQRGRAKTRTETPELGVGGSDRSEVTPGDYPSAINALRAKKLDGTRDSVHRVQRGRQVIRHIQIVSALGAAPQGLTVHELLSAVGGGCVLRTIYRDLEQLDQAGFAVMSEDQRWQLSQNGPRLKLPLQTSELLAVLLAEQALRPILGTSVAAPLVRLREKLLSMVSPKARAYCEELSNTTVATFRAPGDLQGHEDIVATLQEAIEKEQLVRLEYSAPRKMLQVRDVEPYATWFADGRLYVVARCRQANGLRTFAVGRIRTATVLDETFDVDPNFDLEAFVQRGFGVHHGQVFHVVLRFNPEVAHLPGERTFHASQLLEPLDDGALLLTLEVAGLPEIAAWVASFGGRVRAIEPPELVQHVRDIHEQGLQAHQETRMSSQ